MDARNVVEGDLAPNNQGELKFLRGIEVGHIFQLGNVYSSAMQAEVLDDNGKPAIPLMGCYGMGVTRLVAAVIEQNHDNNGIIWPTPLAPFQVHLIALNYQKSESVQQACDQLYSDMQAHNIDVLFDERNERPGVKFADADLIGIPNRIVVGERGLKNGQVEFRKRADSNSTDVNLDAVLSML